MILKLMIMEMIITLLRSMSIIGAWQLWRKTRELVITEDNGRRGNKDEN